MVISGGESGGVEVQEGVHRPFVCLFVLNKSQNGTQHHQLGINIHGIHFIIL